MKKYLLTLACALTLALALTASASASDASQELTLRGRLRTGVEAGCWMLVTSGEQKYHIINSRTYSGESWFRDGAEVEAVGETREVMTTCMEGTPFEARTLRPVGGSSSGSTGAPVTNGTPARQRTRVTVNGESIVQAQPDTAVITIAVVTQNVSASEAQAENASRTDAVVRALRAAAGAGAEVKTSGYSLQPQMEYRPNEPPKITSYLARN
ncbi:MAG TPA: SIMPL domain-containing protein, partial [Pyrinomonadaceae bacterium]|nr:SIMPL domain-containing protein [Pyrinomonadaceae bacterium]